MRHIVFILILMLSTSCQYDPFAHEFTTQEPNVSDIIGEYVLTRQTVSNDGLSILKGQKCSIELREGGNLIVTNYPLWTEDFHGGGRFIETYSTTGSWSCEIVGGVSDGMSNVSTWGFRAKTADTRFETDHFTFTGAESPYGLIMTFGDPDAGTVLIFEKQQ